MMLGFLTGDQKATGSQATYMSSQPGACSLLLIWPIESSPCWTSIWNRRWLLQETDLLKEYQAFHCYDRNGLQASLHFCTGTTLTEETLSWAYNLCKANMEDMYR